MAPEQEKVKKSAPAPAKNSSALSKSSPVPDPEAEAPLPKKKIPKKKKRTEGGNFKCYIHRVLKQVHEEMGISTRAMSTMNSFINDMFERIMAEAAAVVKYSHGKTLTSQAIKTAVFLVLRGEIANRAIAEGNKALAKYSANRKKPT